METLNPYAIRPKLTEMKYKGSPIVDFEYDYANMIYHVKTADGNTYKVPSKDWEIYQSGKSYSKKPLVEERKSRREVVLEREHEKLKEQMAETIKKVTEAVKDELENERKLRTEAEERNEHLRDEVSDLRRELQRRDEQDRGHASVGVTSKHGTYTIANPGVVRDLPGDSSGATVFTRWTDPGSGWVLPTDDTV